jgi:holo-ACP synthase
MTVQALSHLSYVGEELMSVDTPAQAGVSIDALLAAKEQRAARQADWLAHYQQPVISLTLVTPGR